MSERIEENHKGDSYKFNTDNDIAEIVWKWPRIFLKPKDKFHKLGLSAVSKSLKPHYSLAKQLDTYKRHRTLVRNCQCECFGVLIDAALTPYPIQRVFSIPHDLAFKKLTKLKYTALLCKIRSAYRYAKLCNDVVRQKMLKTYMMYL